MKSETKDSHASCPLCASPDTTPRPGYQRIPPGNWSLHLCSYCGTSFLHPMPDKKELEKAYDKAYYGSGDGKFLNPVENIVHFFRYLRARSIRRLVPPGRILDVGCGRGLMLTFLKRWGYEVDGIELDTVAASRAKKNLGQKIFHSLEEIASSSPYNAICFWHSLEHMPEQYNTLKLASKLLAPGGILVIAAPHMESLQSRLAGTHWLHLDLPRHVVHFDMDRLAKYMETQGYVLLHHHHFSQEYNVIDTLCHLYGFLGFDPLYPFNIIRNVKQQTRTWDQALATVLGLSCLTPLTALAFLLSNLFSTLRSGSTTTLLLQKKTDMSNWG